jgi:uncharacterized protein (TIGR02246 family)
MIKSRRSGFRCRAVAVGALMLTLISRQGQGQSSSIQGIRAAIATANRTYIAAHANRDADLVASLYDTAGTRLNPGGQVIRGRAAIRAEVAGMLSSVGAIDVTLKPLDLWVHDGRAYETGIWGYAYTPAGKSRMTSGGRYVTIWIHEADGSWRIAVDMSLPAAPAGTS